MPLAEAIKLPQKERQPTSWVKRLIFPVSFVAGELKRIQPDIYDYFLLLIILALVVVSAFNWSPWYTMAIFVLYFGLYVKIKTSNNLVSKNDRSADSNTEVSKV